MDILFPYMLSLLFGGFGYLFVYYFWEPIRQMDSKRQEISIAISRYANIRQRTEMRKNNDYDGPGDLFEEIVLNQNEIEQTVHKLRQLAGELRSIVNTKGAYAFLSSIRLVPQKNKIESAAKYLMGWSNSFGQSDESKLIGDYINDLAQSLEIPIY